MPTEINIKMRDTLIYFDISPHDYEKNKFNQSTFVSQIGWKVTDVSGIMFQRFNLKYQQRLLIQTRYLLAHTREG